jgi:ABC-2 type transport system permease protein
VVLGAGQNIDEGFMIFGVFASLGPAIAVVIVMQDAVVGEKLSGTASWILSKPASRQAFILSKLVANSLGVLVTMVLVPGIVAYAVLSIASSHLLGAVPFLGAFLVLWITQLFYLTFALMLGALLNSRGAVIGISLALLFLQQYLIGLLPLLRYALPWTLAMPLNNQTDAIVLNLLRGQPVSSYLQVAIILVEIAGFVLISLWRFEREEL